jgi:hypothetical protein
MQTPLRSSLPREKALKLERALLDNPGTSHLMPRLDYVGGVMKHGFLFARQETKKPKQQALPGKWLKLF